MEPQKVISTKNPSSPKKSPKKVEGNEKFLDEIKKLLENGTEAVLLECYTEWCPPCDAMRPVLQEFAKKSEFKRIGFLRLDVDDRPEDDPGPDIRGVPTFQVYELKGKEPDVTDEFVGASPRAVEQMLVKIVRKIADREKEKSRAAKGASKNSDSPAPPAGHKTEETDKKAEPTPSNPERKNAATGVDSAAARGRDAISASNK